MEIIGLIIGFLSSIIIVIGEKLLQLFGFCIEEKPFEFDETDY